ncbi:hypothetical protein FNB79_11420 [Formosa sediminum]|uniref:Uncharacterized protein n=1 Tax=Formosa sediminum TaxID=2594004 RepID=A0A516GSR6_9FLAO|nr:hypothetical protein [Formosa sediminum]QDO94548.1 hypothetical protein FNB79_11420 [Formosa sediminum]
MITILLLSFDGFMKDKLKISTSEKLKFMKVALQKNSCILILLSFFLFLGITIIGCSYVYNIILMVAFGVFIFGMALFTMLYTMPSSLRYHYENEIIKKYGAFTTAIITKKEVEDYSYIDTETKNKVEEYVNTITYEFNYNSEHYLGDAVIDDKTLYHSLTVGLEIPIKYLKTNPNQSSVRIKKLKKSLLKKIA